MSRTTISICASLTFYDDHHELCFSGNDRTKVQSVAYKTNGAAVAERLACSPGFVASHPGRFTPHFRKWGSYRTMPLVGGFSRGSPVSHALSFRRCSILTSLQDLAVKSRPSLSTQTGTSNNRGAGGTRRVLQSFMSKHIHARCGVSCRRLMLRLVNIQKQLRVSVEQRRNERAEKTGDPRENPLISRSSGTIPTCKNPDDFDDFGKLRNRNQDVQTEHQTRALANDRSSVLPLHQLIPRLHCDYRLFTGEGAVDVADRVFASHQDETGSIPGGVAPGSLRVEILPDNAAGQRVFSGISQFPPPLNSGSSWWEASRLTAQSPRPLSSYELLKTAHHPRFSRHSPASYTSKGCCRQRCTVLTSEDSPWSRARCPAARRGGPGEKESCCLQSTPVRTEGGCPVPGGPLRPAFPSAHTLDRSPPVFGDSVSSPPGWGACLAAPGASLTPPPPPPSSRSVHGRLCSTELYGARKLYGVSQDARKAVHDNQLALPCTGKTGPAQSPHFVQDVPCKKLSCKIGISRKFGTHLASCEAYFSGKMSYDGILRAQYGNTARTRGRRSSFEIQGRWEHKYPERTFQPTTPATVYYVQLDVSPVHRKQHADIVMG
ncbi:hypothetical protein PR048_017201 [Dryococelus australis]|uniref:Uncharacterized protein n=1 Tax=Dryococelus australis TaxID=614101 RepID=A0ABQ9H918_9NEOP|nr:hypothetical protein PR048_017201 [Dryococelus australis]